MGSARLKLSIRNMLARAGILLLLPLLALLAICAEIRHKLILDR